MFTLMVYQIEVEFFTRRDRKGNVVRELGKETLTLNTRCKCKHRCMTKKFASNHVVSGSIPLGSTLSKCLLLEPQINEHLMSGFGRQKLKEACFVCFYLLDLTSHSGCK
ncbi:Hypothetical predicted protein [Octopus vulgaris]|uniref:Uncharacterized protein n=1 Tax=Octopus vulgaris TaxID=6645 RepID=A0AA36AWY5_OCTVU|nr:Hypothetical predicted protein [Octopus vulgaris]